MSKIFSVFLALIIVSACQNQLPPNKNNIAEKPAKTATTNKAKSDVGTIKVDASQRGEVAVTVNHTMKKGDFTAADRQGILLVYFAKTVCEACLKQEEAYQFVVKNAPPNTQIKKVFEHQVDVAWYDIPTHPSFIIFKDGREVWRFVGIAPAYKLLDALKEFSN